MSDQSGPNPGTPEWGQVGEHELVAALARFASLKLAGDRVEVLAGLLGTVGDEQAALRGLPLELEPHVVFDPRWD
jgi:hypothetical protein